MTMTFRENTKYPCPHWMTFLTKPRMDMIMNNGRGKLIDNRTLQLSRLASPVSKWSQSTGEGLGEGVCCVLNTFNVTFCASIAPVCGLKEEGHPVSIQWRPLCQFLIPRLPSPMTVCSLRSSYSYLKGHMSWAVCTETFLNSTQVTGRGSCTSYWFVSPCPFQICFLLGESSGEMHSLWTMHP